MIVDIALPISLAIIMYSLGVGLTVGDFTRVLRMPKAVLIGGLGQLLVIPLVAFLLLHLFDLPPAMAFGVMLVAFCPGGVTSNILTKLAGGTVALSITLTAIVSLLSVLTVPVFLGWAGAYFLGDSVPPLDVSSIAVSMFAITAAPVVLGLLTRHFARGFAQRIERGLSITSAVLFVVIVLGAIAENWTTLSENLGVLGPLIVMMIVSLLVLGVLMGRMLSLAAPDGVCISIEMGVQNAALGIAVSSLIASGEGIPEIGIPAAVYGLLMYVITLPVLPLLRRLSKA